MPLTMERQRVRVAICYRNYANFSGISHIGLGVAAMQNCRALRDAGYFAEVWPISSAEDLVNRLREDRKTAENAHHIWVTHVVISALWLEVKDLSPMISEFINTEFVVVSHSNVGFLQVEPNAIRRFREDSLLEQSNPNFHIATNSSSLVNWWKSTYGTPILRLPNIYPADNALPPKHWHGGLLRIGCFCAIRPYKNIITAAAAALEIGVRLRVSQLEFWMSGGRVEAGGSKAIVEAINELFTNTIRAKLVHSNWSNWPQFLKTVGSMDLLLQPSFTEGFNMVTADGIVQGIASVVSDAIDWAPRRWMATSDSASDVADVGVSLLHDPSSAQAGLIALKSHNSTGLELWRQFLQMGVAGKR